MTATIAVEEIVKEAGIEDEPEVDLLEVHATFTPDVERITA